MEEPVFITLPMDPEVDLTCALFDEQSSEWKALECPEAYFSENTATCCAQSFGKIGLIPSFYLAVLLGTTDDLETQVPKFDTEYLVAAILGVVGAIISISCCIKQTISYRDERRRYQAISRESGDLAWRPSIPHEDGRLATSSPTQLKRKTVEFQDDQIPVKSSVATDAGLLGGPTTERRELEAQRNM